MGWGRTTGAKPQPAALPAPKDEEPAEVMAEAQTAINEARSDAAKAEATWASFRSRKGWVPETVALLLYEFVKERGLFTELLAFAKKRK